MNLPSTKEHLSGRSFIGASRGSETKGTFRAIDPATGRAIDPTYFVASPDEAGRAASLAHEAYLAYRKTPSANRAAFLERIADNLGGLSQAIIERANMETALPPARLVSELARTRAQLQMFAELIKEGKWVDARIAHGDPSRSPLPKPDMRSMLQPIGPVAVFGPANFPLAFSVAGGDTASALAAGCPVIVKAHPSHPGTSELVGLAARAAVEDSHLPQGVFSLLFDDRHDIAGLLVRHPLVSAVGFTGSQNGGRALMDIAAARPNPIPVFAEMSSLNPLLVLPEAMARRGSTIASALHASVTLGVGQFCTRPGLVVVQEGEGAAAFIDTFIKLMSGSPFGVMLNSQIREAYDRSAARLKPWKAIPQSDAAVSANGPSLARPVAFVTDAKTFLHQKELSEETFGPATVIVRCASRAQVLAVADALQGNLAAAVHHDGADLENYSELLPLLETKAGRIVFNAFPTGLEVGPATVHGGPYPATSDSRFTAVGTAAIRRFVRPVCYQDCPPSFLPVELRD